MDEKAGDILCEVAAQLAMAASALRKTAANPDIDKTSAVAVMEQAEKVGRQIAAINLATGWNGRDFGGDGSVVTARYDASDIHRITAETIAAVGREPSGDIAHVMPTILGIVFPQLRSRAES